MHFLPLMSMITLWESFPSRLDLLLYGTSLAIKIPVLDLTEFVSNLNWKFFKLNSLMSKFFSTSTSCKQRIFMLFSTSNFSTSFRLFFSPRHKFRVAIFNSFFEFHYSFWDLLRLLQAWVAASNWTFLSAMIETALVWSNPHSPNFKIISSHSVWDSGKLKSSHVSFP